MPPSIRRGLSRRRRPGTLSNTLSIYRPINPKGTPSTSTSPAPPKKSEPLRILFCGSDAFSCASLSALHALQNSRRNHGLIESIDVLVRPKKPAGRGLRRTANSPLFALAESLSLPIHQRDTFTGWTLPLPGRVTNPKTGDVTIHPHPDPSQHPHRSPVPFNLIIAVSFGLFVPPRVLSSLAYGGLNVHPSLLPDLRGPAPLQWTLLAGRKHTGVTLQTLHPASFDRGVILAQTPRPGLAVPDNATTASLLEELAPVGAKMLVGGLLRNAHVPPYVAPDGREGGEEDGDDVLRDAPKITKLDLAVDWGSRAWAAPSKPRPLHAPDGRWTAADLARRFRAVGEPKKGLWTHAVTVRNPTEQRVLFEDVAAVPCPPALREAVMAVVQIKEALADPGGYDSELSPETGRLTVPGEVKDVVWTMQGLGGEEWETSAYRLPLLVERGEESGLAGSVVIPVRVPYRIVDGVVTMEEDDGMPMDAIRVKMVKREGSTSKRAATALQPFLEEKPTLQEITNLDYALDVMAKRVE